MLPAIEIAIASLNQDISVHQFIIEDEEKCIELHQSTIELSLEAIQNANSAIDVLIAIDDYQRPVEPLAFPTSVTLPAIAPMPSLTSPTPSNGHIELESIPVPPVGWKPGTRRIFGTREPERRCGYCDGYGHVSGVYCTDCSGTGLTAWARVGEGN